MNDYGYSPYDLAQTATRTKGKATLLDNLTGQHWVAKTMTDEDFKQVVRLAREVMDLAGDVLSHVPMKFIDFGPEDTLPEEDEKQSLREWGPK